jgi:hypothetical protein
VRGDHFSADVQALIALFEQHRVRYLLVGGEAVIYHGHPRLTGDVDFWFDQTSDNATRLFAALREYWEGAVPGLTDAAELMEPAVIVQFGRPPHRIDLLSAIDGVRFDEAWPNRVEERIEVESGQQVALPVVGLSELVRNKRASGRHKDLDDVEHLEPMLARSLKK